MVIKMFILIIQETYCMSGEGEEGWLYHEEEDDKDIRDNDNNKKDYNADGGGDNRSKNIGNNNSMRENDTDDNRSRIFELIQKNPGTHLRKIVKELRLAMGDVQYHLDILEKSGKIKSRRSGLRRNYYSMAIVNEKDEIILAFLRQETSRDILVYLIEHPNSTQMDIAEFMHFSSPTISWHMSRLIDNDIVWSTREGRNVRYSINGDFLYTVAYLLKTYHPSIWNNLASRLAEVFLEISLVSKTTIITKANDEQPKENRNDEHQFWREQLK